MMKRDLDIVDVLVASGLSASIVVWAFAWAEPYPHPDLWPFLADFGGWIPLTALSVLGKLSLGVFAGLFYLVLRGAWIRFRDIEDELPDKFFFTRFCPLCGAAIFALSSYAWRSAQFLSPGFALLVLSSLGVVLWQRGCGYRNLAFVTAAFAMLTFVAGMNPLGVVLLVYVSSCDIVRRWRSEQEHGQRNDDATADRKRSIERMLSFLGGTMGLVLAVYCRASYFAGETNPEGVVEMVLAWWRGYCSATVAIARSFDALALAVGIGFAAVLLALGRRLRANGPRTYAVAASLATVLAFVTFAIFLRAIDSDERVRLAMMRDYVRAVLDDSVGAEWLFTDGRFDDALRFEVRRRGLKLRILNALMPPSKAESDRMRSMAPEPGDVELFAAGGAEVFKAWARERPDRLARSAWQLGSPIVRRFAKISPCTCGSVMRAADETQKAKAAEADRRFAQMARDVLYTLEHPSSAGSLFGSVDDVVVQRFDALVWRAARMAGERSEAATKAGNTNAAESERVTMRTLDGANGTLRAQGSVMERLLPTASLVLTSRESLEVSLRRADFVLAQRYAHEVLVSSPDDARALFALGMANLEAGEYFNATRYLERALKTNPDEPATLNNLALAYMKLGKPEDARAAAEKALKSNPHSPEIKKNLVAIRKALKE